MTYWRPDVQAEQPILRWSYWLQFTQYQKKIAARVDLKVYNIKWSGLNVNLDVETMLITEEDVKSKNGMRIWHKKTVKSFQEDQTKTYWENEANKPTV